MGMLGLTPSSHLGARPSMDEVAKYRVLFVDTEYTGVDSVEANKKLLTNTTIDCGFENGARICTGRDSTGAEFYFDNAYNEIASSGVAAVELQIINCAEGRNVTGIVRFDPSDGGKMTLATGTDCIIITWVQWPWFIALWVVRIVQLWYLSVFLRTIGAHVNWKRDDLTDLIINQSAFNLLNTIDALISFPIGYTNVAMLASPTTPFLDLILGCMYLLKLSFVVNSVARLTAFSRRFTSRFTDMLGCLVTMYVFGFGMVMEIYNRSFLDRRKLTHQYHLKINNGMPFSDYMGVYGLAVTFALRSTVVSIVLGVALHLILRFVFQPRSYDEVEITSYYTQITPLVGTSTLDDRKGANLLSLAFSTVVDPATNVLQMTGFSAMLLGVIKVDNELYPLDEYLIMKCCPWSWEIKTVVVEISPDGKMKALEVTSTFPNFQKPPDMQAYS